VGIVTSRDHFVLDLDEVVLKERIADFQGIVLSDDEVRERHKLKDKKGWSVADARKAIRQDKDYKKALTECLYRPFDIRPIFYHNAMIERTRPEVMHHMLAEENLALLVPRQVASNFQHVFCTSHINNFNVLDTAGRFGSGCLFPLYLYPTKGEMQFEEGRRPNLNPEFIKAISGKLGLKFVEDGKGDLKETFGPEDIFNYAYAIFHSPTYRSRYEEFLKIDFPRLPLTSDKKLFQKLVEKGGELVSLHLMESPTLEKQRFQIKYDVPGANLVDKVTYNETAKRVYINKDQYFEGVPPEIWSFHIGGYQVCRKWLKDRKGKALTYDERMHYQKIVIALKETIRLMGEIDALIPVWPVE